MNDFGKSLYKIALPVTLQCMLQSSFSIVDQLMIGQLGAASVSAVGLGGNYSLIYSVIIGAVGSVAGILISQFLGAEDQEEAWSSFTLSSLVAILVSLLFTTVSLTLARPILGLYTEDAAIVSAGIFYFKIVGIAYIPMGINTILSTWLRCREHATFPLVASFCAVIINTGLNYLLIFGKLGFPELGIKGAAYATLTSSIANLLLVIIGFAISLKKDGDRMKLSLLLHKVTFPQYLIMIGPILFSEFLWSLGQNVESGVYGHLSTQSLAAYTLTTPIQGLFCGALSGLSAAAGVIIGKRLGAGEFDGAYRDSKRIMVYGLVGSLVCSLLLIGLSGLYVSLYPLEADILSMGRMVLIVFAIYAPVKVENMILGGGILKSGGDTKTVMIIDIIGTWAVGIPLCFFAAYALKLQIVGVYSIFTVEEVVRLVISFVVFKKKKWMRNLAEENHE